MFIYNTPRHAKFLELCHEYQSHRSHNNKTIWENLIHLHNIYYQIGLIDQPSFGDKDDVVRDEKFYISLYEDLIQYDVQYEIENIKVQYALLLQDKNIRNYDTIHTQVVENPNEKSTSLLLKIKNAQPEKIKHYMNVKNEWKNITNNPEHFISQKKNALLLHYVDVLESSVCFYIIPLQGNDFYETPEIRISDDDSESESDFDLDTDFDITL